ncbi:hypothetical protein ACP70R_008356 [Stipagrostis hirtigluma subsp. patula]
MGTLVSSTSGTSKPITDFAMHLGWFLFSVTVSCKASPSGIPEILFDSCPGEVESASGRNGVKTAGDDGCTFCVVILWRSCADGYLRTVSKDVQESEVLFEEDMQERSSVVLNKRRTAFAANVSQLTSLDDISPSIAWVIVFHKWPEVVNHNGAFCARDRHEEGTSYPLLYHVLRDYKFRATGDREDHVEENIQESSSIVSNKRWIIFAANVSQLAALDDTASSVGLVIVFHKRPEVVTYNGICAQCHHEDIINSIEDIIIREVLCSFQRESAQKPQLRKFYRDGKSKGQLNYVSEKDIADIQKGTSYPFHYHVLQDGDKFTAIDLRPRAPYLPCSASSSDSLAAVISGGEIASAGGPKLVTEVERCKAVHQLLLVGLPNVGLCSSERVDYAQ